MIDVEKQDIKNNYLGWVPIPREWRNKGWYRDSEYVHLMLELLLCANHKEVEFLFNGKIMRVKPGQFITGRKELSVNTGIQESKVERILNCFENEHLIEQQKTNKYRIITMLSAGGIFKDEQQNEQELNNKRTTSEHKQ